MLRETKEGLLAAAIIAAAALLLPSSAVAKPKHKPDLDLARARIVGQNYALTGERATIRVSDKTENSGKATAPRTTNKLTIRHRGAEAQKGMTRNVPKLGPGKYSTGTGTAHINIPAGADVGAYEATLCADGKDEVNEDDEGNNCESLGKFFIVKRQWTGSLGGSTSPLPGVTESWHGSGVRFELDTESTLPDQGFFDYRVTQGTVSYNDSGTSGNCTVSGSGVDSDPNGEIRLFYSRDSYLARTESGAEFSYLVTVSCPDGSSTYDAPIDFVTLETGENELPFGITELAGTFGAANYEWSFR